MLPTLLIIQQGETVKKVLSDAEIDRMIRIERLKGIYLDKQA
jgi:hypothetical protein